MMKVLMLSTDASILKEGTEANARMREYAGLFDELHIIVSGRGNSQKNNNLYIYPTNHHSKITMLFTMYRLGRLLKDMTVISSQDSFELGIVGYFLKRKLGVPLQLQVHTDFLSPYFWHESLKNKIRVLMAKWLLPKADGVRVVSERIKRSLITNYQLPITKIEVSPIFVDTEKIKNAPVKTDLRKKYPQFDFIILMASRLSREKNIGLAIRAMSGVNEKYPRTGLMIIGSGPEESCLKAISYKLKTNIIFEPWTDDLASYYKTTDLFLLTSEYEGYGRTIVEAIAVGLPVVMTDVGVAGELVRSMEEGRVFPVGDARACAESIKKIIAEPDLRKKMANNASARVSALPPKEKFLADLKNSLNL